MFKSLIIISLLIKVSYLTYWMIVGCHYLMIFVNHLLKKWPDLVGKEIDANGYPTKYQVVIKCPCHKLHQMSWIVLIKIFMSGVFFLFYIVITFLSSFSSTASNLWSLASQRKIWICASWTKFIRKKYRNSPKICCGIQTICRRKFQIDFDMTTNLIKTKDLYYCGGCRTWLGRDGKVMIERWYLSPYVEKPFNSKVIKSFIPELRSCKCFSCFGIPMFYVYMSWTFYVRFTYSCMGMLQPSYCLDRVFNSLQRCSLHILLPQPTGHLIRRWHFLWVLVIYEPY